VQKARHHEVSAASGSSAGPRCTSSHHPLHPHRCRHGGRLRPRVEAGGPHQHSHRRTSSSHRALNGGRTAGLMRGAIHEEAVTAWQERRCTRRRRWRAGQHRELSSGGCVTAPSCPSVPRELHGCQDRPLLKMTPRPPEALWSPSDGHASAARPARPWPTRSRTGELVAASPRCCRGRCLPDGGSPAAQALTPTPCWQHSHRPCSAWPSKT
jgi:hypothetical protein